MLPTSSVIKCAMFSVLVLLPAWPQHVQSCARRNALSTTSTHAAAAERAVLPLMPIGGAIGLDQAPSVNLNASNADAVPADWYAQVTKNIAASEYHINWQEGAGAFQSPNRQQDLRITYRADGFSLRPRVADSLWSVDLALEGIGRQGQWHRPSGEAAITVTDARLVADHDAFAVEYQNAEEGMRQNFIVREKPAGAAPLEVRLRYSGTLRPADKGGNAIAFCEPVDGTDSYVPVVWYKDLHVWDANGDTLEATASLENDAIVLSVLDHGAQYPITVDPLSTTADWNTEVNQTNAFYGFSISSAGDVNGDGYSDVIVGAHGYDNGQADEGRAYVFHGSATGLSATANWNAESNQTGAAFGYCVANAGDVNGDGFGDVIIGVRLFDNGQTDEGRAVVYHGSATGLGATVNWSVESNQADAQMGYSVALAGDVNGDGYSDVIVGIRLGDYVFTNDGRASVFHGSATGLSPTLNWSTVGNQNNAQLGTSVAGAGDVNGDGYSDVVVGADLFDNGQTNEGRAWVFHGSSTGLLTTAAWTAEAEQANANLGTSVSTAGDVNGDGYSDVIVGAPGYSNGQAFEGRALVFHGGASGLSATANWTAESDQASASFGFSVDCAGDVNGDGFADVLVGAYLFDNGQADEGLAYLYEGSATGLAATASWTTESDQASAYMGGSVSSAGDVNGDGYSDVIIGVDGFDNGQANEGRASVFHGSAAGLATSAAWTAESDQSANNLGYCVAKAGDVNGDGFDDVVIGVPDFDTGITDAGEVLVFHGSGTGLTIVPSWSASGSWFNGHFGSAVASAGDVNGDGYNDVVIGQPGYGSAWLNQGRAYVFHGGPSGLSAAINWWSNGAGAAAGHGGSVASAGDVNGDGYSDVLIGAIGMDNNKGRAYLFRGSPTGLGGMQAWTGLGQNSVDYYGYSVSTAGDVNGDGFSDFLIGSPLFENPTIQNAEGRAYLYHGSPTTPTLAWTMELNQANAQFGGSLCSVGDVNGDGFSDVAVSSMLYENGQTDEGAVFVYLGGSSGLSTSSSWMAEGNMPFTSFGSSVSSAGDVNGDGYSDLVIGALGFDGDQSNEGRAFLFLGGPAGLAIAPGWTMDGNQIAAGFGYSVDAAGDVNGDGYSDIIIGAPSFDNGQADEGMAFLYHGNNGTGRRHNLRLYNTNLTAPISASNIPVTQFGAGLYAKPFLGRQRTRLVWETRIQGQAFSSAGGRITNSTASTAQQAASTLTAVAGTELKDLVNKLTSTNPITATKVRARLRYPLATALTGQVFGPWRYMPGYLDGHGTHNNIPLPVEMLWLEAACDKGKPLLTWATATEQDNSHFVIDRSSDAERWEEAGRVAGVGHSQQVNEYAWSDDAPLPFSTVYYRLRQVALDGHEEVLAALPLEACGGTGVDLIVLPNPTDGPVEVRWNAQEEASSIRELRVLDAHGRVLLSERVNADASRATVDLGGLAAGVYSVMGVGTAGAQVSSTRVIRK